MTTASALREVRCATLGCVMQSKAIAYTDGREALAYCSKCRKWTRWHV